MYQTATLTVLIKINKQFHIQPTKKYFPIEIGQVQNLYKKHYRQQQFGAIGVLGKL